MTYVSGNVNIDNAQKIYSNNNQKTIGNINNPEFLVRNKMFSNLKGVNLSFANAIYKELSQSKDNIDITPEDIEKFVLQQPQEQIQTLFRDKISESGSESKAC